MNKKLFSGKIDKLFYENVALISDFEFEINADSKIVIFGKTGTGKTSLLHLFNKLNTNYAGQISYKGDALNVVHPIILRSSVMELTQFMPPEKMKVSDFMQIPYSFSKNKDKSFDKAFTISLIHKFELQENVLEADLSELSGGERQRVYLIRLLGLNPEMILLDEPSSALDKEVSALVCDYVLNEFRGAVVCISHDHVWQNAFPEKWELVNKQVKRAVTR